jgi:hypothetical protein
VYLEKGACVKERERERERNWYSFCIQLYFYIIIYIPSTLDAGYYYIDFCLLPETRTFDGATNLREEATRDEQHQRNSVVRPFSSTTTTKEKG